MGIEQGFFSLPLIDVQGKNRQKLDSNARQIRAWMKSLSSGQLREFRLQKTRALRLMQLDHRHHFRQWGELFEVDPEFSQGIYESANERLAKNFGIPPTEINPSLERHAEGSNTSVKTPRDKMPSDVAGKFEIVNEVELANHPVDLLKIIFDPKFSHKAQFEAARKINHMEDDAIVEENPALREKRKGYQQFTRMLNEQVWMKDRKTGEFSEVYFLSKHDPNKDFKCIFVEVREINFSEADELSKQLPPNQKLVVASRRRFQVQTGPQASRIVDIYISNRLKTNEDRRVKFERKDNGEDPHSSNKDAIGARIVTNTIEELELFIEHLQYCADKIGSDIRIHDIKDSLNGEDFDGDNPGSSKDVQMIKFIVRIANIELEMQGYDSVGFANASFKRGPSHPEYWWNRLFNSGWFDRNFPPGIYQYNPTVLQKRLIRHEREQIEKDVPTANQILTKPEDIETAEQVAPSESPRYFGKLLTTVIDRVRRRFGS